MAEMPFMEAALQHVKSELNGCGFSTCQAGGVGELVQDVRQQPREQLGQHRGLGAPIRRRHRKAQEDGRLRCMDF